MRGICIGRTTGYGQWWNNYIWRVGIYWWIFNILLHCVLEVPPILHALSLTFSQNVITGSMVHKV